MDLPDDIMNKLASDLNDRWKNQPDGDIPESKMPDFGDDLGKIVDQYKSGFSETDDRIAFDDDAATEAIRKYNETVLQAGGKMPIPENLIQTMIRPLQDKYYANFTKDDMIRSIVAQEGEQTTNMIGVNAAGELVADSGKFKNFLDKQVENLKLAPMMYVMNQYLEALLGKQGMQYFNLSMSAVELAKGDPIPLILTGIFSIADEFAKQHVRDKSNDDPYSADKTGSWGGSRPRLERVDAWLHFSAQGKHNSQFNSPGRQKRCHVGIWQRHCVD